MASCLCPQVVSNLASSSRRIECLPELMDLSENELFSALKEAGLSRDQSVAVNQVVRRLPKVRVLSV